MVNCFYYFGNFFINLHDSLTKTEDPNKYHAVWLDGYFLKGTCDFTIIDENKHASNVDIEVTYKDVSTSETYVLDVNLLFSNWGTTVTPTEDIASKINIDDKITTAVLQGDKFVTNIDHDVSVHHFNMPSDLSLSKLRQINVTGDYGAKKYELVLNGKELIEDVDYTTSGDEYVKSWILNTPLKANDKLSVIYDPISINPSNVQSLELIEYTNI